MINEQRILFIDDEDAGRRVALFNLEEAGYQVDEAASAEEALGKFSPERHHAVITDIRMPGLSGIDLLKEVRKQSVDTPVLLITAYESIDTAVEAMKMGAYDFIVKPFTKDRLLLALEKALEHQQLKQENQLLRLKLSGLIIFSNIRNPT